LSKPVVVGVYRVLSPQHRPRVTIPLPVYREMGRPEVFVAVYLPDIKAILYVPMKAGEILEFIEKKGALLQSRLQEQAGNA